MVSGQKSLRFPDSGRIKSRSRETVTRLLRFDRAQGGLLKVRYCGLLWIATFFFQCKRTVFEEQQKKRTTDLVSVDV